MTADNPTASRRLAREAYINGYLTFDELDRVSRMIDVNDVVGIRDLLLAAAARFLPSAA